nr:MAG TPA: hypothetical protein [Caudoviricetes sp.]
MTDNTCTLRIFNKIFFFSDSRMPVFFRPFHKRRR